MVRTVIKDYHGIRGVDVGEMEGSMVVHDEAAHVPSLLEVEQTRQIRRLESKWP